MFSLSFYIQDDIDQFMKKLVLVINKFIKAFTPL